MQNYSYSAFLFEKRSKNLFYAGFSTKSELVYLQKAKIQTQFEQTQFEHSVFNSG